MRDRGYNIVLVILVTVVVVVVEVGYVVHSALQEDTGFSIVTQETDDIFKIFKQIHDWKS